MTIEDLGGEIKISGLTDFDIVKTFECGQCFRWNADSDGAYTGMVRGRAGKIRQDSSGIYISGSMDDFNTLWREYFDIDRDYEQIRQHLCITEFMCCASQCGAGIRILRQEPWEALCSFIISQNNNIPRIKKIIDVFCRLFGEPVMFNDSFLYTFPSPEKIAVLSPSCLSDLRCGYRAAYLQNAARAVAGGSLDFSLLSKLSADKARTELKNLKGVGDKVADCIMLFGLHMLDVFPVDVWMKRALAQHFDPGFDPSVFSPYAGIAQQYIFYYMRSQP